MSNPLKISQQKINGLWSIRANASHGLNHFCKRLFNKDIHFGEMIATDSLRLIQLWRGTAYLFSEHLELPTSARDYENMITDISHGFCAIKLTGENTLTFLNKYCSADIPQSGTTNQCLRTSLGHYQILIWWDSKSEVQLLVDRSYARSFTDYLNALTNRN